MDAPHMSAPGGSAAAPIALRPAAQSVRKPLDPASSSDAGKSAQIEMSAPAVVFIASNSRRSASNAPAASTARDPSEKPPRNYAVVRKKVGKK